MKMGRISPDLGRQGVILRSIKLYRCLSSTMASSTCASKSTTAVSVRVQPAVYALLCPCSTPATHKWLDDMMGYADKLVASKGDRCDDQCQTNTYVLLKP
jgi:hypothetical protein